MREYRRIFLIFILISNFLRNENKFNIAPNYYDFTIMTPEKSGVERRFLNDR